MSDPFIAEIKIFAGNFAPRGYAFCDGQLLPIAQNTALFSLVGTIYGGDGRTTFGLPNLQGRAALHSGGTAGPGLTRRRLGETGGVTTVALTDAQLPAHRHDLQASSAATDEEGEASPAAAVTGEMETSARIYADLPASGATEAATMAADMLAAVGGDAEHNNRQPYLVMNFIIALIGTFPSRS